MKTTLLVLICVAFCLAQGFTDDVMKQHMRAVLKRLEFLGSRR